MQLYSNYLFFNIKFNTKILKISGNGFLPGFLRNSETGTSVAIAETLPVYCCSIVFRHTPALYPPTSAGFRSPYSTALPVTSANLTRFSPPTFAIAVSGNFAPGPSSPRDQSRSSHCITPTTGACLITQLNKKYNSRLLCPPVVTTTTIPWRRKSTSRSLSMLFHVVHEGDESKGRRRMYLERECSYQPNSRPGTACREEEQAKYYELARKERQLHMQLYPGWSARDNCALQVKKKKRKKDRNQDGDGNNLKKCRARFGLDQQSSWCKPCR
ncbi:hypothetical protein CEXT_174251 [Caerostris extrusa]|uniref:Uncharacterized protein n=1 Tax=Caerostris extrusa TaxID=172846 RepID=A0AAV4S7P6_CAEEX|nr:hypothetical protein CEXT_174251 [Caerostris extrusa]